MVARGVWVCGRMLSLLAGGGVRKRIRYDVWRGRWAWGEGS